MGTLSDAKDLSKETKSPWGFHDTPDPLIRYLRDRRLEIGVGRIERMTKTTISSWKKILVVCGGVGGEGTYLRKKGCTRVLISDKSLDLARIVQQRDRALRAVVMDAENLGFTDQSFDFVVVQDGIHHLKNPVLGLVEMLRVARKAVLLIEPHQGWVAKCFGTKIEKDVKTGDLNFVFRWNPAFFRQVASSYLVGTPFLVEGIRLWDHNFLMGKFFRKIPGPAQLKVKLAQTIYGLLQGLLWPFGNMFIGIVIKRS